MSQCLKTGGIIFVQNVAEGWESDLHVVGGGILVAVVTHPRSYIPRDGEALDGNRINVIIPEDVDYFLHDTSKPYGTISVKMSQCLASDALQEHIKEWWPHSIRFANFERVR